MKLNNFKFLGASAILIVAFGTNAHAESTETMNPVTHTNLYSKEKVLQNLKSLRSVDETNLTAQEAAKLEKAKADKEDADRLQAIIAALFGTFVLIGAGVVKAIASEKDEDVDLQQTTKLKIG